jgi:hypothetical protein
VQESLQGLVPLHFYHFDQVVVLDVECYCNGDHSSREGSTMMMAAISLAAATEALFSGSESSSFDIIICASII